MSEHSVPLSALTTPTDLDGPCVEWPKARNARGHGRGQRGGVWFYAHVAAYEARHGPVTPGLVVHHLCGYPPCCNPDHLVAVTRKEHAALHPCSGMAAVNAVADTCINGHPFDVTSGRQRVCLTCARRRGREWARRKREAVRVAESRG